MGYKGDNTRFHFTLYFNGYENIPCLCNAKHADTATVISPYRLTDALISTSLPCASTTRRCRGAFLCGQVTGTSFRSQPLSIQLLYTILPDL